MLLNAPLAAATSYYQFYFTSPLFYCLSSYPLGYLREYFTFYLCVGPNQSIFTFFIFQKSARKIINENSNICWSYRLKTRSSAQTENGVPFQRS